MSEPRNNPDHYVDLHALLNTAVEMLTDAAANTIAPMRTPCLVTNTQNGDASGRIIILRKFNPTEREIIFYTDLRSEKMAGLKHHPHVALIFYDASQQIQLRLSGQIEINNNNDVSKAEWNVVPELSRRNYLSVLSPGTEYTSHEGGLSQKNSLSPLNEEQNSRAYENFSVIRFWIESLDWLFLSHEGNRRAKASWSDPSQPFLTPDKVYWCVP